MERNSGKENVCVELEGRGDIQYNIHISIIFIACKYIIKYIFLVYCLCCVAVGGVNICVYIYIGYRLYMLEVSSDHAECVCVWGEGVGEVR